MKKLSLWFATFSWAGLTLYLTTIPNFSPARDSLSSWLISNGGHFFFFGILAILLKLSISTIYDLRSTPPAGGSTNIAILFASLYGLGIEFVQLGIPGRSFDLKDWVLDTLGAIIFLAIMKKMIPKYYL